MNFNDYADQRSILDYLGVTVLPFAAVLLTAYVLLRWRGALEHYGWAFLVGLLVILPLGANSGANAAHSQFDAFYGDAEDQYGLTVDRPDRPEVFRTVQNHGKARFDAKVNGKYVSLMALRDGNDVKFYRAGSDGTLNRMNRAIAL